VRFVKIPAQPSWSLPLFRSCGLSAPTRSHEPCSLGFHRVCLSAGVPAAVLSRCASAPSDSRCQPAVAFRSRGFSPPQRFAPAAALRACCIPLPARGSSLFRHPCLPTAETKSENQVLEQPGGLPGRLPRRRFSHPSEFSPRQQPYRVTHLVLPASTLKHRNASTLPQAAWVVHLRISSTAVAFLTFPPVRLAAFHNPVARTASNCDLPESAAFKALLHCRVRCDAPSLLIALRSLLPWA
jgi:hypothetical protein